MECEMSRGILKEYIGVLILSQMVLIGMPAVGEESVGFKKKFVNPYESNFSNVVTISSGGTTTLHVSGQVGFLDGELPEEFARQAENAFENIARHLAAAGANLKDIVKINVYIVGLDGEKTKAFNEARTKFLGEEDMPASTLLGIQALIHPSFKIEIEAIAVIKNT